jgi:GTP-binding protein
VTVAEMTVAKVTGAGAIEPPGAATDERSAEAAEREAALAFGRWLFAQECEFINGSTTLDTLPPDELPEIAFAGRSNVGKSSLVNALTGRKTLARTSHTPGRTQQINFFALGGRLMLVDLPGYGYADAPKSEIRRWTQLVNTYLKGRPRLRRVCLLIDGRHGLKPVDEPIMRMLDEAAVSYQIVLTKADKVRAPELARRVTETGAGAGRHVAAHPLLHATSAHDAIGLAELRAELAAFAIPV